MDEDNRYWYMYVFSSGGGIASTYIGYDVDGITKPRIEYQKTESGLSGELVCTNIVYLGLMTRDVFLNQSPCTYTRACNNCDTVIDSKFSYCESCDDDRLRAKGL